MELSLSCRCWSVLRVVLLVLCYQGKVSSERAQGCVGSQLSLRCPEMKVISISVVVLGDTNCLGATCCIKDKDCIRDPNENHVMDVRSRCNGRSNCTVDVFKEEITCGYLFDKWSNNDFERISYNCIDDPQRSTTSSHSRPDSTEDILQSEKNSPEKETENCDTASPTASQSNEVSDQTAERDKQDQLDNPWIVLVVMAIVCLLILIIIVVAVVMMWRKSWPKLETTDNGSIEINDAIHANEDQTTRLTNSYGSPVYSNHKIKKSRCKGAKASETYEVPIDVVYSFADHAGSIPTEAPSIFESDGDEEIYANENQTTTLINGNRAPIYTNDKIKKSNDKDTKAFEMHDVLNAAIYSLANDAGTQQTEARDIYSEVESRKPAYQLRNSSLDLYSFTREVGGKECYESRAAASNEDSSVYRDVKTRKPAKVVNSSAKNVYDEACNWKESEHKAVKAEKPIPAAQKQKTDSPAHKRASDSYANVSKPLKNAATFDTNAEDMNKVSISDGFPGPTNETMLPAIGLPEGIYANQPALSPSWSVASRPMSTRGSETESPYCNMQSPPGGFTDNGGQTVIENDLYSH